MRASMNLGRLHEATQFRLDTLLRFYQEPSIGSKQESAKLSYIAVELDNLNVAVLREFTVSTLREAKTCNGARIKVKNKIDNEKEIASYILSITNSVKYMKLKSPKTIERDQEQAIRDPKQIEPILIDSKASNLPSLQSALALNATVFQAVKPFRHFYAHRCFDTYKKAVSRSRAMGILNPKHPDRTLTTILPGRPHSILEDWIIEAKLFYELLMH